MVAKAKAWAKRRAHTSRMELIVIETTAAEVAADGDNDNDIRNSRGACVRVSVCLCVPSL